MDVNQVTPEMARHHHLAWLVYSSRGQLLPYPHVARMSRRFMRMIDGRARRRLAIKIPPQFCKSTTTTECLATYFLGRFPDKRVSIVSYGSELAEDFGFRNRCRMEEFGKQVFGVEVDHTRKSRKNWLIKGHPGGGMVSVGIGGSLTGKRTDLLIVDDPFKNFEDAMSATNRDKVWNWFNTVAMTRLSDNALVVVIHTIWHPEDLIGRLTMQNAETGSEPFDVISFPAIATEDEYDDDGKLFRREGESLCPQLHPLEQLQEMQSRMSSFQWSCLYQQDPTQPGGCQWAPNLFGEEIMASTWPNDTRHMVAALDTSAGKDTKYGDYPSLAVVGTASDGNIYVDMRMERVSPSIFCEEVAQKLHTVKQQSGRYPAVLGVEEVGLANLYAERLAEAFNKHNIPVPIVPISHANTNKLMRIQRLDPYINKQDFRFIQSRDAMLCLQQFRDFPLGKHDDGPDAVEMAMRLFGSYISAL